MLHKNIVKAFEKLGLEIKEHGRYGACVRSGGRFADWHGKEKVESIYVSTDKREEDWGHNYGCAGWFYDTISRAIAEFEDFFHYQEFTIGVNLVKVQMFNHCRVIKNKLEYHCEVHILPTRIFARFTDPEQVAFLRSCPPADPLFDFLIEFIPEFEKLTHGVAS